MANRIEFPVSVKTVFDSTETFNKLVGCFGSVQLGHTFGKDFSISQLRLDIARLRVLRWGKSLGLNIRGTEVLLEPRGSQAIVKQAEVLLDQILELFAEAENTSNEYKKRTKPQHHSLAEYSPQTDLDPAVANLHRKLQQLATERQNQFRVLRKAKWVLYDEGLFQQLIEATTELVDRLVELFPATHQPQCELCNIEVAAIGESEGIPVLREIAAVQDKLLEHAITNPPDHANIKALYEAAFEGYRFTVELLIGEGTGINAQGGLYGTSLQAASFKGHIYVVRMLLDRGADVNAKGGCYGNALQAASFQGHEYVVKILLDYGADVNAKGGCYGNALQAASFQGHEDVVKILLDRGAYIDALGGRYGTALQAASTSGNERIVDQLLRVGADANAQGDHSGTALQAASSRGFRNLAMILLKAGANIHSRGGEHGSALQAALCGGHQGIADVLRAASKTSKLQAWPPGQTNPQQRSYRNVSQMLQGTEHSDLGRSMVNMRFECEIPAVVSAQELSKDRRSESWTKELIQNNVVLVCSRSKSDGNEKIQTMRALTCIEYIESRWGSLGTRLLGDIAKLYTMQPRYQLRSGQ
jgi:ankyrin repeat protein